jgi:hypothetical protein
MQAIQHEHGGVALDNAEAALRTACLTGVATVKMTDSISTPSGDTIQLTAHRRLPGWRARRSASLLQALRLAAICVHEPALSAV